MATLQQTVDTNVNNSDSLAGFTTLPGQTQPEGTTGQMVDTVQPPQEPPQPEPVTPQPIEEERVESPTVVSTDSMRDQLSKAEQDLKRMRDEIDAGQVDQLKEESAAGVTPSTEPEALTDSQRMQAEIDSYTEESNKLLEQRKNDFNRYMTRSDNLLRSQTRAIQKKMDIRRADAEKVAQNAKAATNVLGARTGRLRYAPEIQRGIITGQENALIETLAELDSIEASAIANAEQAAFTRDYSTFLDEIDNIDGIRKERENKLEELNEALETENKRREDELEMTMNETKIIEQISAGITDPIQVYNALNGDVPYDIVKAYTDTLPSGGATEFEFVRGDKYNSTGYFDPTTGDFVNIGTYRGDGGTTVIGSTNVGLVTPNMNDNDIDSLNISESAKAYVKLWKDGRITQEEILQRIGGDKADRVLRDEIMGVIANMTEPATAVNADISVNNRNKANTAVSTIDDILSLFEDRGIVEAFDLSNTAAGRVIGQFIPGTSSRNIAADITTLKGMIAFDELQKMRDASPTGGALGQVTERELDLLASQAGSLDIGQSSKELVKSLQTIRKSFARVRAINSPDTTPNEYKEMFPDATDAELAELTARNKVREREEIPTMSNSGLLLGDEEEPVSSVPSVLDSL